MRSVTAERMTGVIVGLGGAGALLSAWLVASELFRQSTCPPLLGIPACVIVLAAYLLATVGAWRSGRAGDGLFFIGAGIAALVGVNFSVAELGGAAACPSFEGLPMCYASLLTASTMLVVDAARRRLPAQSRL